MLTKPPLSFIGNKSKYKKIFIQVLKRDFNDQYVYVDLFGGSGYLSYVVKYIFPNAKVIYNDYDNYLDRVKHISDTNNIIQDINKIFNEDNLKRSEKANAETKAKVINLLEDKISKNEYIDINTISSQILFSGNSTKDIKVLKARPIYNRINKKPLDKKQAEEYIKAFNDIKITHCDYMELYNKYKDKDNVVLLVDPPYLDTNCDTYNMSWEYIDFIKVLSILRHKQWFYFTSNKTKIYELLKYFDETFDTNILKGTETYKRQTSINHQGKYDDILIVKSNK